MKIKSIKLHPFAGITNKEIELSDGLNLIFGPNEIGKSTLFNAIQHGILTTTRLTSSEIKNVLNDYFPLGGGDVIRVTMVILLNGDSYKLFKEWKPGTRNGKSNLIQPDGTEITNEEDVQNWILDNLPVKAATMREIMLAKQSALHQTLTQVEGLSEVKQDISAVLRKSVMETGGISVDKFRDKLDIIHNNYFENWNRAKSYPKEYADGRQADLDNKRRMSVGKVLEAWYTKEQEKRKYNEIVKYEKNVDNLNQQLQERNQKLTNKKKWLDQWEPNLDKLREKEVFEEKLKNIQKEYEELNQIAEHWPVYKMELKEQKPKLEKHNQQIEKLDKEQRMAIKKSSYESLQKRVTKLNDLKAQISDLDNKLKNVPNIRKVDFEAISSLQLDIESLQVQVNASELSLSIEALKNVELRLLAIDGKEEIFMLSEGETRKLTNKGVATIQTDHLRIRVASGIGNTDEVIETLSRKKKALNEKLALFRLSTIAELKPTYERYQRLATDKENKQSDFRELLEEGSHDELIKQLEAAPNFAKARDLTEIQKERDEVVAKLAKLRNHFEDMKLKVEGWEEKYKNTGGVFSKLGSLTTQIEDYKKKLIDMPQLPEQFERFEDFKQEVKDVKISINELKDKISEVEIKIAALDDPETSAEEQEYIMEDAEANFENILAKAESLHRVKEKTDEILSQLEQKTYTPLVEGLIKWLSKMSDGRFEEVQLNPDGKEIPDKFVTSDKKEIPFHLLSHGTKDLTALAWRLAVIDQFLQDKKSCILLDDPLVDMDRDRKKWASRAIEEMAEGQQVLLFSCHDDIIEILAPKNTIRLV